MALAFIPILSFVALSLLIHIRAKPRLTLRDSLLISVVICAGWLVLGTELLSLAQAIRFWPILLWWLAPLLALAGLLGLQVGRWRAWIPGLPRLTLAQVGLILVIGLLMGWCSCQAFFSPPNNVDSLSYHLQRQIFWMQQGSVENYPTSSPRQLAMPPLTEFAGLHLMILSGSDRWHNLVQWAALLLTMCAVSLMNRKFGGGTTAQLLAALWVVTIPVAFLQASNTKNDVVVALWTCLLTYWVFLIGTDSRLHWPQVMLVGVGFGALMLTKATGIIFALPITVVMIVLLLRYDFKRAIPALMLTAALALAMNSGAFVRNYRTFGSPVPDNPGIHGPETMGNEDFSARAVASNLLRNVAPHFVTPSQRLNNRLTRLILELHEKLGMDVNEPKTTWVYNGNFRPYEFMQDNEDQAAAPGHMFLLLLLPLGMLATWRRMPWGATFAILFLFLSCFVLFSTILKWQYWHVRLIIAMPALVAPIFAWSWSAPPLKYFAAAPVAALLAVLYPSLNSVQRPLWGPQSIFRRDPTSVRCYSYPEWAESLSDLADQLARLKPRVVGLNTRYSFPDYTMQRLVLERVSPPPRFVGFNATVQIPGKPEPDPDVVLAIYGRGRLQHESTGTWYVAQERFSPYTLLVKESRQPR